MFTYGFPQWLKNVACLCSVMFLFCKNGGPWNHQHHVRDDWLTGEKKKYLTLLLGRIVYLLSVISKKLIEWHCRWAKIAKGWEQTLKMRSMMGTWDSQGPLGSQLKNFIDSVPSNKVYLHLRRPITLSTWILTLAIPCDCSSSTASIWLFLGLREGRDNKLTMP